METEIWKKIDGFDGIYEVSNLGRVRSIDRIDDRNHFRKGIIMKSHSVNKGYQQIILGKHREMRVVHRLVALAFVDGYFEGAQVNHKDENVKNNRADNLEWCTAKYNCNYGRHRERQHERAKKMTIEKYALDGTLLCVYGTLNEAAKENNMSTATVHDAVYSKTHISKGYIWIAKNTDDFNYKRRKK